MNRRQFSLPSVPQPDPCQKLNPFQTQNPGDIRDQTAALFPGRSED